MYIYTITGFSFPNIIKNDILPVMNRARLASNTNLYLLDNFQ